MRISIFPVIGTLSIGLITLASNNSSERVEVARSQSSVAETPAAPGDDTALININKTIAKEYQEAEDKFYFAGYPINPAIVADFSPGVADMGPILMSIDLAVGNHSNRYSVPDSVKGTTVYYDENTFFKYTWLGKTDNGIHVVRSSEYPEGTGHYEDILFFSFKIRKGFGNNHLKNEKDQLIMTLENNRYSYSEMAATDIKIIGNKVRIKWVSHVSWEAEYNEEVEELSF